VKQRLQKILAQSGYGSRRSAEKLISGGRVRVNRRTVTELGTQADPKVDRIEVNGQLVEPSVEQVYLAMNKPQGVTTTSSDPQKRRMVMDLLPRDLPPHVLPVGRLDRDSEGLLVFTNDGELAHRLAHPRYQVDKEYHAEVLGRPARRSLALLRRGVDIGGHRTSPAQVDEAEAPPGLDTREGHTWLRFVIHEGRRRQVRLMCAAAGHPVRTLVRTRIGDVRLDRLARGKTRPLTRRELDGLRRLVRLSRPE